MQCKAKFFDMKEKQVRVKRGGLGGEAAKRISNCFGCCVKRLRRLFGSPAHAAVLGEIEREREVTEKRFIKLCARRG